MRGVGVYALWGVQNFYCTAKTCSYLIKKGVPYRELYPSYPQFQACILPKVQPTDLPVSVCGPIRQKRWENESSASCGLGCDPFLPFPHADSD